jgi:RNA polymerase sigma-70 factor (ECF subfamily)
VPTEGEPELLRRAQAGDRASFDRLRAALSPVMRRFVRRLIGRTDEAEEILQDAFVALFMNLDRLAPPENVRPFLFRIIRNRCYDELRRRGRFVWMGLDGALGATGGPAGFLRDHRPLPEDETHWAFLFVEVRQAIDHLPELQRQTLILYFEDDLSYAQIAATMATDIGTVKSRLFHARKNLSARLRPETLEALGIQKDTDR